MIQRLHVGPRMSQAVIHGNTVYLAEAGTDRTRILTTRLAKAYISAARCRMST